MDMTTTVHAAPVSAGGDGLKPLVMEGELLLKTGADPTSYYGPPQDAETRRIAGGRWTNPPKS
jgi:hypothetical protein